ncbi:MAG: DUF3883 domain-containing protein [Candidatus Moraniibacteriota bacterium]|nr:MAG: DUF3883 domain-containing protein [Candidatus Moranbacteria bacterium]
MLKELSKYENLGTPKLFWELFNQFDARKGRWNTVGIDEYLRNRLIDGRTVFDGCVPFLEAINIINIAKNGAIIIGDSFLANLKSEEYLRIKILKKAFSELEKDSAFKEIFIPENFSYDVVHRNIQIKNSAFRLKYSKFKQLLIDFNFLIPSLDINASKLVVNGEYRDIFDSSVLPSLKRRKLTAEDLYRQLEENRINGELAENFVLGFERLRLGEQKSPEIEKISDYDVSAGYDIVSFESVVSSTPDRFIEVKSYIGEPTFFWTRNEIDVAKVKNGEYFIYLVDRNGMARTGYHPIIIKNPYRNVLNDKKWNKIAEKYFIYKPN